MKKTKPLDYKILREILDHKDLKFKTTEQLALLDQFLGQKRAIEAIAFGIGIESQGYNLYAMGPAGIGKYSLIKSILDADALKKPTPPDWIYLHNFETPEKPIALQLPKGVGSIFQKDMKHFVQELSTTILGAFESDEYHTKMQEVVDTFNKEREVICNQIVEPTEQVKIPRLYKQRHQKEIEIQKQYTLAAIKPLIDKLKKKYADYPPIIEHLSAIENDIVMNVNELIKQDENNVLSFNTENPRVIRYQVNLLVNNENTIGAPVIYEKNPNYSNLICRVEYNVEFGASVTNFMLIKPGTIHKANGGYLIIDARRIKKEKHAWESLKQALYEKVIPIEPLEHFNDNTRPVSLEPMPIPLNIKVILLGNRNHYYALINKDSDFNKLFKVAVDFDEEIERNKKNIDLYARLIAKVIYKEKLQPFNASGVAAAIDHSTRIAQDKRKLSTHIRSVYDLLIEANYWAIIEKKKIVDAKHVKRAICAKIHRMDRVKELYYEEIKRNFILINTSKSLVGQINCLSVVRVGKFSYGHPTRITAKVRPGKGKFIDIQHEIKLAGPMHSKAGLILSNFLASRYDERNLFSLAASISFEQIYGMMDGDSASIAELCALLSALAILPIKQNLAVTGAIDQYGNTLAIGGLNEKLEGFYDVCQTRPLKEVPGVIIPAVNVDNLMLREDVVQAAKNNKFVIYAVETVDEAMELLMGLPAGERNTKGEYPEKSINYLVERRLIEFSRIRQKLK